VDSKLADYVLATVHPSSILRARTPEERQEQMQSFIADLQRVAEALAAGRPRRSRPVSKAG